MNAVVFSSSLLQPKSRVVTGVVVRQDLAVIQVKNYKVIPVLAVNPVVFSRSCLQPKSLLSAAEQQMATRVAALRAEEGNAVGCVPLSGLLDHRHKAKVITPSIAWKREAWKEEAVNDLSSKDERGPSSVRRRLELFERQRWGNL